MEEWWPTKEEYDPGLTKEDWLTIIKNRNLCEEKWLHILARFYEYGGKGACSEIEDFYNETRFTYNIQMKAFADRLVSSNLSHYMNDEGNQRFFPIIFVGRDAQKDEPGSYIWKLRDELKAALEEFDIVSWDHDYLLRELASRYKTLLEKHDKTEFLDEELYKWEYVTENLNADPLTIITYLIKNNMNIYDRVRDSQSWKTLMRDNPQGLKTTILKLKDESVSLHDRISTFKTDMDKLFEGYTFSSHANDERTAACFLSCWYPQAYTLYKDGDLYEPLCLYLGIKKQTAGSKYEHFIEIARQLASIVHDDAYLQNVFKSEEYMSLLKRQKIMFKVICLLRKR